LDVQTRDALSSARPSATGDEADDLRVVVAGAERVGRVEVRDVVVVAAVLAPDRLVGVDVPDVGASDLLERLGRGEDVVQRADQTVELIRLLVGQLAGDVGVTGLLDDLDRILLVVGVEVAGEEDVVGLGRRGPCFRERHQRVRLPHP